jgi:hypothetical protein
MKKILFIAALSIIGFLNVANAQGKAKKTQEVHSKEVSKSRGANPNIKAAKPSSDDKVAPKPAKSRGSEGNCCLEFNNLTGYFVDVYVDGYFRGTLDAWGSAGICVPGGYTTVYCITIGGTREWSAAGSCTEEYEYNLSE